MSQEQLNLSHILQHHLHINKPSVDDKPLVEEKPSVEEKPMVDDKPLVFKEEDEQQQWELDSVEGDPAPSVPPQLVAKLRNQMVNWSVDEAFRFIKSHKEIERFAHIFAREEVDGEVLLYIIDEDPSYTLFSMFKPGPALKIKITLSRYKY